MTKRTSLKARSASVQAAIMAAGENDKPSAKSAATAKQSTKNSKPIGLTVRLSNDEHEAIRKIAFNRRVSIHSLIMEGVNFVIKKY